MLKWHALALVGALSLAANISAPPVDSKPSPVAHKTVRAADTRTLHDRVLAWSPGRVEMRFLLIPWTEDVDAALARAKREHRLIFAMVSNGDLCTGRL